MKRPNPKKLPGQKIQQRRLSTLARAPKRLTQRDLENSVVGQIVSRRRFRRIVASVSVGAISILLIIVGSVSFSSVLAVKEIFVSGTDRISASEISKALKDFVGTPLPLIDQGEIAQSLEGFELIESFSATAMPPNGLQIRISERQPLAIVTVSGQRWLYDPAGVRIARAKSDDKLPEILISENPLNSQRYRNAIDVLLALPEQLLDEVEFIEAKTKDDVRLSLRSTKDQRIVWGDSSNSVLKSKVLQALMKNHRRSSGVTFDVSSPNAPVVRFDGF